MVVAAVSRRMTHTSVAKGPSSCLSTSKSRFVQCRPSLSIFLLVAHSHQHIQIHQVYSFFDACVYFEHGNPRQNFQQRMAILRLVSFRLHLNRECCCRAPRV